VTEHVPFRPTFGLLILHCLHSICVINLNPVALAVREIFTGVCILFTRWHQWCGRRLDGWLKKEEPSVKHIATLPDAWNADYCYRYLRCLSVCLLHGQLSNMCSVFGVIQCSLSQITLASCWVYKYLPQPLHFLPTVLRRAVWGQFLRHLATSATTIDQQTVVITGSLRYLCVVRPNVAIVLSCVQLTKYTHSGGLV